MSNRESKQRGMSLGLSDLVGMAQQSKVIDKGHGYLLLPIEDVVSKTQVRKKFEGIEELAQTIKRGQQQTPIQVAPINDDGKYVILRGERRWRACKLAGLTQIKAVIDDYEYKGPDRLLGEIIENVQRSDLTAMELAAACHELQEKWGMRAVDIALELGKSRDFVTRHLAIYSDLPQSVRELYQAGHEMSVEAMYTLIQVAKRDPETVETLCAEAMAEGRGITRSEARRAQQQVTRKEEQKNLFEGDSEKAPQTEVQDTKAKQGNDAVDESCAGTTNESHQDPDDGQNEFPELRPSVTERQSQPEKREPKQRKKGAEIALVVSVLVDDTFQKGVIDLYRKIPREGYVYVHLDNGVTSAFSISDLEFLDVRNEEQGS